MTSELINNENWNKVFDLLTSIQAHIKTVEDRILLYEILLPKDEIKSLREEQILLKEWKSKVEAESAEAKKQSFTWIHAIAMVLITVSLSTGLNVLATPDQETVKDLKQEIELLKEQLKKP